MLANFLNTQQTFVCQHCWQTHVGQHLFVVCPRLKSTYNTEYKFSRTETSDFLLFYRQLAELTNDIIQNLIINQKHTTKHY